MSERTPQDAARLAMLARRIIHRNAENADDANEIAAFGCDCGAPNGVHRETCPVQIAYDATRSGLWQPEIDWDNVKVGLADEPSAYGCKCGSTDGQHTPGCPIVDRSRATCNACGRYATTDELIRHKPGCMRKGGPA